MSVYLNLPIRSLKRESIFVNYIYLLMCITTIVYTSQAYRIFLKSSDSLLFLRITEDYVLICLFFIIVIMRGKIIFQNLVPFVIIFAYCSIIFMLDFDFAFIRRFIITMLWYTVAINALTMLKPEVIFRIICVVGIFSALSMLLDTEKALLAYMFENQRYHSEGEGGDININNICLILVSFVAVTSVLKKNMEYLRDSNILMISLFLSVGVVLLIGATRSAIAFYLVLIFYNVFKISTRAMFKAMFISTLLFAGFSFAIVQFGEDLIFVKRFLDYDYRSSQRILMSMNSLSVFSENPIFGFGEENLAALQMQKFNSQDHNLYTKILGSNGVIGFIFVMFFYICLTKMISQKVEGIYILKGLFFYIFIFTPAGPGTLTIAAVIHYLTDLQANKSLRRS